MSYHKVNFIIGQKLLFAKLMPVTPGRGDVVYDRHNRAYKVENIIVPCRSPKDPTTAAPIRAVLTPYGAGSGQPLLPIQAHLPVHVRSSHGSLDVVEASSASQQGKIGALPADQHSFAKGVITDSNSTVVNSPFYVKYPRTQGLSSVEHFDQPPRTGDIIEITSQNYKISKTIFTYDGLIIYHLQEKLVAARPSIGTSALPGSPLALSPPRGRRQPLAPIQQQVSAAAMPAAQKRPAQAADEVATLATGIRAIDAVIAEKRAAIEQPGVLRSFINKIIGGLKTTYHLQQLNKKERRRALKLVSLDALFGTLGSAAQMIPGGAFIVSKIQDTCRTAVEEKFRTRDQAAQTDAAKTKIQQMKAALHIDFEKVAQETAVGYYDLLLLLENVINAPANDLDSLLPLVVKLEQYWPKYQFLQTYADLLHQDVQKILTEANARIDRFKNSAQAV